MPQPEQPTIKILGGGRAPRSMSALRALCSFSEEQTHQRLAICNGEESQGTSGSSQHHLMPPVLPQAAAVTPRTFTPSLAAAVSVQDFGPPREPLTESSSAPVVEGSPPSSHNSPVGRTLENLVNMMMDKKKSTAAGKAEAGAPMKRPAAATVEGTPKRLALTAGPAAVQGEPTDGELPGGPQQPLGCGKCRGHPAGCGQCKNPAFSGKRWTRAA